MSRLKLLTITLFVFMLGYTYLLAVVNPVSNSSVVACPTKAFNSFIPWDSGCFYSALFEDFPTVTQVNYEHEKLNTFYEKGGVAQHLLLYRSIFYRRFKDNFNNVDYDLLEKMHKEFTYANSAQLDTQVSYVNYLYAYNEHIRAQDYIDYYCHHYVPVNKKEYVYKTLFSRFEELELKLSLQACKKNIRPN